MNISIVAGAALVLGAVTMMSMNEPSQGRASKVGIKPGGITRQDPNPKAGAGRELATLGGGCFWGIEGRLRQVPGVLATAVGYTGGHVPFATYEQVCSKTTGHTEAVLVEFDPKVISYRKLVDFFWTIHNPTTLNRQGPDIGSNYRSAIYTHSEEQLQTAIASRDEAAKRYPGRKIVTEIKPAEPFYMAEEYHQQYHEKTGTAFCPVDKG